MALKTQHAFTCAEHTWHTYTPTTRCFNVQTQKQSKAKQNTLHTPHGSHKRTRFSGKFVNISFVCIVLFVCDCFGRSKSAPFHLGYHLFFLSHSLWHDDRTVVVIIIVVIESVCTYESLFFSVLFWFVVHATWNNYNSQPKHATNVQYSTNEHRTMSKSIIYYVKFIRETTAQPHWILLRSDNKRLHL